MKEISKKEHRQKDSQVVDAFVMILQFGINMIVPICMCMAIGIWIGEKTGATWAVIPLFFMGALAGGTNIYKMSKKLMKQEDEAYHTDAAYYQELERLSAKRDADVLEDSFESEKS